MKRVEKKLRKKSSATFKDALKIMKRNARRDLQETARRMVFVAGTTSIALKEIAISGVYSKHIIFLKTFFGDTVPDSTLMQYAHDLTDREIAYGTAFPDWDKVTEIEKQARKASKLLTVNGDCGIFTKEMLFALMMCKELIGKDYRTEDII